MSAWSQRPLPDFNDSNYYVRMGDASYILGNEKRFANLLLFLIKLGVSQHGRM